MSEVSNRRFVHFDGTKQEFIDGGYPDQYQESIVFINGDGKEYHNTIYTHGEYYGNGGIISKGEGEYSAIIIDSSNTASGKNATAFGNTCTASSNFSHAEGEKANASGIAAHAEGMITTASKKASHAEGRETKATNDYSHAEGYGSIASGSGSHAEGVYTKALNIGEHAEGRFNFSHSSDSNAFGLGTNTMHSVGIGLSTVDRKNAHEIMQDGKHYVYGIGGYFGYDINGSEDLATVIDNFPIVKGYENSALLKNNNNKTFSTACVALGNNNTVGLKAYSFYYIDRDSKIIYLCETVQGLRDMDPDYPDYIDCNLPYTVGDVYSIHVGSTFHNVGKITNVFMNAVTVDVLPSNLPTQDDENRYFFYVFGKHDAGTIDIGSSSFVTGSVNLVVNEGSYAEGKENVAYGKYSHAEGKNNIVYYCSHAEGSNNQALGNTSHTEGTENQSLNSNSHTEGRGNKVTGYAGHAEGYLNEVLSDYGHAEGEQNSIGQSTAKAAHVEGMHNDATGLASHAEGRETLASGSYSHAEGKETKALNNYAHTEGEKTTASGIASHAEGLDSSTGGKASHVEGRNNTITEKGEYSHAGGYYTTVDSSVSFASGLQLRTKNHTEVAFGKYNYSKANTVFSIGSGTSDSDRKNLLEIEKNGDIIFYSEEKGGYVRLSDILKKKLVKIYDKDGNLISDYSDPMNILNKGEILLEGPSIILLYNEETLYQSLMAFVFPYTQGYEQHEGWYYSNYRLGLGYGEVEYEYTKKDDYVHFNYLYLNKHTYAQYITPDDQRIFMPDDFHSCISAPYGINFAFDFIYMYDGTTVAVYNTENDKDIVIDNYLHMKHSTILHEDVIYSVWNAVDMRYLDDEWSTKNFKYYGYSSINKMAAGMYNNMYSLLINGYHLFSIPFCANFVKGTNYNREIKYYTRDKAYGNFIGIKGYYKHNTDTLLDDMYIYIVRGQDFDDLDKEVYGREDLHYSSFISGVYTDNSYSVNDDGYCKDLNRIFTDTGFYKGYVYYSKDYKRAFVYNNVDVDD